MKLIERKSCVITGGDDLETLHSFPNFPVFMGCVDQPESLDLKQEMAWNISRGSGLIQLKKLIPLENLYPESHGAGAIGVLWEKHHNNFAKFISKYNPKNVVEIGGSHGILYKKYENIENINWTIIEPNPSPTDGCKARFIKAFFNDKLIYDDYFDTVVHSHVFEHMYEPDKFMEHLSRFMSKGQNLIFSVPNLKVMLERKYTNCINFEHTIFLIEEYIEYLLTKNGFLIQDKEYFMDDHSIFYAATRELNLKNKIIDPSLYYVNRQLYVNYIEYHKNLIQNLNFKINQATQKIYLFGAHVFSQYLIAFGLNTKKIISIIDNDKNKQGKRLYGTKLNVMSPQVLNKESCPIVILKAGVYNNEIKEQILMKINSNTIFYE
jgi:hypothetical protein